MMAYMMIAGVFFAVDFTRALVRAVNALCTPEEERGEAPVIEGKTVDDWIGYCVLQFFGNYIVNSLDIIEGVKYNDLCYGVEKRASSR
jgi:hypothetical protein